jgi:hypothetical protein
MNGQIVALLSAYGVLTTMRREGHRLFGRCPVHGGDNPRAFVVDLERDCWYCFSRCGRGGGPVALARGLGLPAPQGGVPAPPPLAPFTPYTRALGQRQLFLHPGDNYSCVRGWVYGTGAAPR